MAHDKPEPLPPDHGTPEHLLQELTDRDVRELPEFQYPLESEFELSARLEERLMGVR